jgi:cyanuric acid amidohydrolase
VTGGSNASTPRAAQALETQVFRLAMDGPNDISALRRLFDENALDPAHIAAVIGKTEGNGGVNDFTRGYFTQSFMSLLAERLGVTVGEATRRAPCVLSGGTEGVLSPHIALFARVPSRRPPAGRFQFSRPGRAECFIEEVPVSEQQIAFVLR